MAKRQRALAEVAGPLKTELFGIDDIIDRVIDAVRAWYVLLRVALDAAKRHLCVSASTENGVLQHRFAVALELNKLKQRAHALTAIASALQAHGLILKEDMAALMAAHGVALAPALEADAPLILEPFAQRLAGFAQQGAGENASERKGETSPKKAVSRLWNRQNRLMTQISGII